MSSEVASPEHLLSAARTDPRAFAAFYRQTERQVLGFFMRATRKPELAADLTAETFACALESIGGYDRQRGRADQWLFGIARNVLAASYRKRRVESSARERLGMPRLYLNDEAIEAIEQAGAADEVLAALAQLPEEQQEAIEARVLDELEYGQIAGELCCSEAVVRQRVSRGLRNLRARMAGESG